MTTRRSIQPAYKEIFSKTHIGSTPSVPSKCAIMRKTVTKESPSKERGPQGEIQLYRLEKENEGT